MFGGIGDTRGAVWNDVGAGCPKGLGIYVGDRLEDVWGDRRHMGECLKGCFGDLRCFSFRAGQCETQYCDSYIFGVGRLIVLVGQRPNLLKPTLTALTLSQYSHLDT